MAWYSTGFYIAVEEASSGCWGGGGGMGWWMWEDTCVGRGVDAGGGVEAGGWGLDMGGSICICMWGGGGLSGSGCEDGWVGV